MDEATNIGAKPEQPASHELGSVPFSGRPDALFERHLLSDAVVEPSGAYDRQRLEALASRSGSKHSTAGTSRPGDCVGVKQVEPADEAI